MPTKGTIAPESVGGIDLGPERDWVHWTRDDDDNLAECGQDLTGVPWAAPGEHTDCPDCLRIVAARERNYGSD